MSDKILYSVKQQWDAFDALAHYGKISVGVKSEQQLYCPFHTDGKKSARLYTSGDEHSDSRLWCFACGKLWDGIAIVAQQEGLSYRSAAHFIHSRMGKTFELTEPPEGWAEEEKTRRETAIKQKTVFQTGSQYKDAWAVECQRLEAAVKRSKKPVQTKAKLYLLCDTVALKVRENEIYLWEPKARTIWEKVKA